MACGNANERKCFTYIWKIENASYCWQQGNDIMSSSVFAVEEIEGTKHMLGFSPSLDVNNCNNNVGFCLIRLSGSAEIECQLALLASDGAVLYSSYGLKDSTDSCTFYVAELPVSPADIFVKRKSEFLPKDTLTVSCKIWKRVGEFSEDTQWIARTRIGVEKRSFLWKVGNVSSLKSKEIYTYEILSHVSCEIFIYLDLFLTGESNSEEIRFAITPKNPKIKFTTVQISFLDALGKVVQSFKDELRFDMPDQRKQSSFCLSKAKLVGKCDVLSLQCVCEFPSGSIQEMSEWVISDNNTVENSELENSSLVKENVTRHLQKALNDNLKSMLNEGIQSDVKLKTRSKTYPAHKCILSARSPVFNAMFSNDMKEKIKECVDIEDLNDDTIVRMLQYIYSAEVKELEWSSATHLYEASDKYEILTLRDVCSSYLKNNLCRNNACEALVLADLHQDEDLKGFVQDFILRQGKDVINSEEWEQLMETNPKLAAETMRLKYK